MKKRFALCAVILLVLAVISGVHPYGWWKRTPSEQWLAKQSPNVAHIKVRYGSCLPGSIWKHVALNNSSAMRRLLTSIHYTGGLTHSNAGFSYDFDSSYNVAYGITMAFKDPNKPAEGLSIYPNYRDPGGFIITREDNSNGRGIIGWATMSASQFQEFTDTLASVPGNRRAWRS